jgi:hypothetical protein
MNTRGAEVRWLEVRAATKNRSRGEERYEAFGGGVRRGTKRLWRWSRGTKWNEKRTEV